MLIYVISSVLKKIRKYVIIEGLEFSEGVRKAVL